jgi:hypothetical protein
LAKYLKIITSVPGHPGRKGGRLFSDIFFKLSRSPFLASEANSHRIAEKINKMFLAEKKLFPQSENSPSYSSWRASQKELIV